MMYEYTNLFAKNQRNDICEAIQNKFWLIDLIILGESFEENDLVFMIGARWPNLLCGSLLWLFQWKELKQFIKDQLPEGTEFQIVLL